MTRKIVLIVVAVAALIAVPAAPSQAVSRHRATIAVELAPNLAVPVSCPDDALFGFALDISSLAGTPLGSGRTCVRSLVGCDPFVPFCYRSVTATLTLGLPRGSLTANLILHEVLPTESSFIQVGYGAVTGGTGDFTAARGRIAGGGQGAFDEQFAFTGRLVYIAALRGVA